MDIPSIFPDSSNIEETIFSENDILYAVPFNEEYDDSSSQDVCFNMGNQLEQENPFTDDKEVVKTQDDGNKDKGDELCWSRKAFNLVKSNNLVRSAPISYGSSAWDIVNNGEKITLPVLGCGKSDSIKRISACTVVNLLKDTIKRNFILIDARFKYEYEGGHIRGSININNELDVFERLKNTPCPILIFYCEMSSVRGPGLAKRLRNLDRVKNIYPALKFPEIYILEGGYKKFYKNFSNYCTPNSYVQMYDKRYRKECTEFHKKTKTKQIMK